MSECAGQQDPFSLARLVLVMRLIIYRIMQLLYIVLYMKDLAKAMGKASLWGFQYLVEKFPNMSTATMKEGIFTGPQVKSVSQDKGFKQCPSAAEREQVVFLGSRKSPGYKEVVQKLLDS